MLHLEPVDVHISYECGGKTQATVRVRHLVRACHAAQNVQS